MRTPPKPQVGLRPKARRPSLNTWQSRVALVLIELVLLLTTVVLGRFGLADFLHALNFPGRLTGAILLAVSLTTLVGAAAVLDHWVRYCFPYSGFVALVGAFTALLANAMLLVTMWREGDSTFYKVVFGGLAAGSAAALYMVWRTSVMVPTRKRVAAAVIIPSVIAVANYGYQNLWQPYERETSPVITLAMGKAVLSNDRKAFAVPVDITLANRGDRSFYVLGSEFHAMAQKVTLSPKDRLREKWRDDADQWNKLSEVNPLSRREIHQPGELVVAKPWLVYGSWTNSGDTLSTRVVVQLPLNTPYDQVTFYATANLARKDRLALEPPLKFLTKSWGGKKIPGWVKNRQTKDKDDDFLVYRARVREDDAIDEYTRDARYVTVYWRFGTHGASVSASIARLGEEGRVPSQTEDRETTSRYGLVDLMTGPYVRNLWDIKTQH
ncbi:hypothetical protein [Streptomyces sp. 3214.6]|uniref:hypothetical protein n=1 Tax=Streptomyces sp. 3214.6 TaxID=1882757 RepID=UPI000909700C|nr:hypothetical protein [Streptomyces sp. 3214.6]SHI00117.1 hypothetical protein SAMN05444521_3158 [Streptomyces sp. 3214.6]